MQKHSRPQSGQGAGRSLYDRHTDLVWRATLSRSAAGGRIYANPAAKNRRGPRPLRVGAVAPGCPLEGGMIAPPSAGPLQPPSIEEGRALFDNRLLAHPGATDSPVACFLCELSVVHSGPDLAPGAP
jgi:hypothetical protein